MRARSICKLLEEWQQYLSSKRVKKDHRIWIFGAIRGNHYSDNAKYFFEYINENTTINAVWITRSHDVVELVRQRGYKAFHIDSHEARHYAERARVALITHRGSRSLSDLPFQWLSKDTFIVQLWHGIPLKRIAFDDHYFSFRHNEDSLKWKIKSFLKNRFFPFREFLNNPMLIPASSEETKAIYSRAFRVADDTVTITGHPRDDHLIQSAQCETSATGKLTDIIYMPTFRGEENSGLDLFTQYGFSASEIDHFLNERGLRLHIKLHPFNHPSPALLSEIEHSNYIVILDCDDIYQLLSNYCMLITDYSSIYFDFLHLERPIVYAPFDRASYLGQQREFYFNYEEVTPGPKASNWSEVMVLIDGFLEDPNWYMKERQQVNDRFHSHSDSNSCLRLYKEIEHRIA